MKRILVPLDGSTASEKSVPYAEKLARTTGATLVLMRGILTAAEGLRGARSFNEVLRSEAHGYLQRHCKRLQSAGLECQSVIVDDEAGHAILKAAADQHVDLIVMSTHGRGGLARAFWGSIADRVMRPKPWCAPQSCQSCSFGRARSQMLRRSRSHPRTRRSITWP